MFIIDHLISETGKILYITGTHGNQAGVSGLSHPAMLDHRFYLEDCMKVGVVPGPLPEDLQEKENNTNIEHNNNINNNNNNGSHDSNN